MVSVRTLVPSTTSVMKSAVWPAILVPFSTAFREASIRAAVLLEASADLLARLRTSSATTANPFPALPARAASTAAFRARIFVWNAISSIVLIIFPISLEELLISSIAAIISCIWPLLSAICLPVCIAFALTSIAFSALLLTCSEISLMVAASSSMEEACSVAPCDKAWAPEDTCSLPLAT